jgi:hypothetical protein
MGFFPSSLSFVCDGSGSSIVTASLGLEVLSIMRCLSWTDPFAEDANNLALSFEVGGMWGDALESGMHTFTCMRIGIWWRLRDDASRRDWLAFSYYRGRTDDDATGQGAAHIEGLTVTYTVWLMRPRE